jgi:hypothetical protein
MLSAASLDTCLDDLCRPAPRISSNPDIAGIGVISSYSIQFGFVMTGLLSLILCAFVRHRIRLQTDAQSATKSDKDKPNQHPTIQQMFSFPDESSYKRYLNYVIFF